VTRAAVSTVNHKVINLCQDNDHNGDNDRGNTVANEETKGTKGTNDDDVEEEEEEHALLSSPMLD
jgi:hypothetical protein